jgi:NAD(P)H dehydrogenase (quinone)
MAEAVAEGAKSVPETQVEIKEAETVSLDDIVESDALIIGTPVHMGSMDWRVKKFIDSVCGPAWMENKMVGKVGAVFSSGSGFGNAGGGTELAMLALLNNLAELGMVIVPLPKSTPGYPVGGLHWGPYGRAHDENLNPIGLSEDKLEAAKHHGIHVARVTKALKGATIFG